MNFEIGIFSLGEKMPISKFMAHLGVHGVCPRTGVPVPEPAPEARPGRPVYCAPAVRS